MSGFLCRVVDAQGRRAAFRREAEREAAVLRDLDREGYFILSVAPASSEAGPPARKLKPAQVLEFTLELASLMTGGLGLKEALSIAGRIDGSAAGPLLRQVEERVGKGDSLFDSLSACGSGFSPLYLGLVRIGEKSGDLSAVFRRLGEYLSGRQALRDKLINSLVYPAFVLCAALAGTVLLTALVLPRLSGMLGSLNPQAAAMYQRKVSAFRLGALAAGALLALVVASALCSRKLGSRDTAWTRRFDALALRVPLLGAYSRVSFGLHFSFAMETLLSSGYSPEDALEESSSVVGNAKYRESLLLAREGVVKGALLSSALRNQKVFPQALVGWMAVGEGAGDLAKSFSLLRAYYQKETDKLYARFMNLAEPVLIAAVGIMLVALVLSFVTPIFSMMGDLL
jgi:type II secretory pathway component PulF